MKVTKQLVPNENVLVLDGVNGRKYITIHETGNFNRGTGAKNHATLQEGGYRGASWHYQVDDKYVIQSYLHTTKCAHAGDGRGDGNSNSIAIEVCVNPDSDRREAWKNVTWLVRKIMKEEGIPASRVVQHNHWTGKNCPSGLRSGFPIQWSTWKKTLSGASPKKTSTSKPKATKGKQPYSHDRAAQEVIDGKWGVGADRKKRLEAAGFVYNSVQRRVNAIAIGKAIKSPATKSTTQLAREVLDGKHGNGAARQESLGSRYDAVQREVNRLSRSGNAVRTPAKSNYRLATEVLQGKHGTGAARQKSLGSRYNAVQKIVNQRLR